MMFIPTLLAIASVASAFAIPQPVHSGDIRSLPTSLTSLKTSTFPALAKGCSSSSVSSLTVPLPSNQTVLTIPANQTISAITVGRGIQNYTCTNGAWVTAGALANLYDVSGIFSIAKPFANASTLSEIIPEIALQTLSYPDKSGLPVLYRHQFVSTPASTAAGAISPKFFSSKDQFIGSKTGSLPSPVNSTSDVAWLQLTLISGQGNLAKTVFRLDTQSGQPPSSCTTAGALLSVDYAAMYFFLK